MHPEQEPQEQVITPVLDLVHTQSEFGAKLARDLEEFSNDVISYRSEDIEKYGQPGDEFVIIRAPRNWGKAVLRVIE
jgi:hypothetical protein